MKSLFFFLVLNSFCLLFCVTCNNGQTNVIDKLSPSPPFDFNESISQKKFIYGQAFQAQSISAYGRLLSTCKRCGVKRLIDTPSGTVYQRYYGFDFDPKKCKNWTQGYIQIEFLEKKLPTQVIVSIKPEYTGLTSRWGETFSVKATARPTNENKGFAIFVRPSDGIGGIYSLVIKSESSNHILRDSLDVLVIYGGQGEGQTILNQTLPLLEREAIKKATVSCDTYTN